MWTERLGGWLCLLLALPLAAALILSCNDSEIIMVDKELKLDFPGRGEKYRNNLNCTWMFKGHGNLTITFLYTDVENDNLGNCYDYIHLNETFVHCYNNRLEHKTDNTMSLMFYSDKSGVGKGFKAVVKEVCTSLETSCDLSATPDPSWILVYRISPKVDDHSLVNGPGSEVIEGRMALDAYRFGTGPNASLCYLCEVVRPNNTLQLSEILSSASKSPPNVAGIERLEDSHQKDLTFTIKTEMDEGQFHIAYRVERRVRYEIRAVDRANGTREESGELVAGGPGRAVAEVRRPDGTDGRLSWALTFRGISATDDIALTWREDGEKFDRMRLFDRSGYGDSVRHFQRSALVTETGDCFNGGKRYGEGCSCPGGYGGPRCERHCGPDRFGPDCEARCSKTADGCKGIVFCVRGLECGCGPGWGGRYCGAACPEGRHGPGCLRVCPECREGVCDPYTGVCHRGCLQGRLPPYCLLKFPYLAAAPSVRATPKDAYLHFETGNVLGEGQPVYYEIQYRKNPSEDWHKTTHVKLPGEMMVSSAIHGLSPGMAYDARVVLLTEAMESYEGEVVPRASFWTPCVASQETRIDANVDRATREDSVTLSWRAEKGGDSDCPLNRTFVEVRTAEGWRVEEVVGSTSFTVRSLLPGTEYRMRLRPLTPGNPLFTSVKVRTAPRVEGKVEDLRAERVEGREAVLAWENASGEECPVYLVEWECAEVLGAKKRGCPGEVGHRGESMGGRTVLESLRPYRRYEIKVREEPGAGYSSLAVVTPPDLPDAPPASPTVTPTSTSLSISWGPPEDDSLVNGNLLGYRYEFSTGGEGSRGLADTFLTIQDLEPSTEYWMRLYMINEAGWNPNKTVEVKARTLSMPPSAVRELEVYEKSRHELGLRWGAPERPYGKMVSYRVGVGGRDTPLLLQPPPKCTAYPGYFCTTLTNLSYDTEYEIFVWGRNEYIEEWGESARTVGRTKEETSEPPRELSQISAMETELSIRWLHPFRPNGRIRSYYVKIEQIHSAAGTCCQVYPKTDVKVGELRQANELKISTLEAGSRYMVSVSAEGSAMGQPAMIEAMTRPKMPEGVTLPDTVPQVQWEKVPDRDGGNRTHALVVVGSASPCGGPPHPGMDPDLAGRIREAAGANFYLLAAYGPGSGRVVLGSGPGDTRLGTPCNTPLPPGTPLTLAAVAVAANHPYYSVALVFSEHFHILYPDAIVFPH